MITARTDESQTNWLDKIFAFLNEIGIEYYLADEDFDSFLPGVKIESGKLKIKKNKLLCLGDILHEAGHLACIPANLRSKANDDISNSVGEEYTFELGVIAWSFAAAHHIALPLSQLFHKEGYNGDGEWLVEQYSSKNYMGLPLLQWMELCAFEEEVDGVKVLPYPSMLRWTRA